MLMRSALYKTLTFCWIYLIETTIRGQTCRPTRTHYLDFEPTSLFSFSLMLRAQQGSNTYQFHSLWFDPDRDSNPLSIVLQANTLSITPAKRLFVCILMFYRYKVFSLHVLVDHTYIKNPASANCTIVGMFRDQVLKLNSLDFISSYSDLICLFTGCVAARLSL